MFELLRSTSLGRRGKLTTAHGIIESPFFMPVGTAGAMRGITLEDLSDLQAQILLCNTYHLHLQPGEETIAAAGGLHSFIGWNKPILTDSGGFQVFSLKSIRKISEEGVAFRSHRDGSPLFLGPKEAIEIQWRLGSDIIMNFDECPPSTASRPEIEKAVDRTLRWAKVCKETHDRLLNTGIQEYRNTGTPSTPLLFGIIQGGLHRDLRRKCAEELVAIGFDGYAIGGLAVGESEEEMMDVLRELCPLLPADKPRYLMGVGVLHQLKACTALGIDMFDCVLPMRIARHGTILLSDGTDIRIKNSSFASAHEPIDPDSPSLWSRRHLKSYLHHLFALNERYAESIACKQNLGVTLKMMQELRKMMDQK
ncbi:MAG: tRNA guanosine(34) transglycosylase Tgt [Candidatus Peregrinibacteria bacterium]